MRDRTTDTPPRRRRAARGNVLVYSAVLSTVIFGFGAFAVDYGRRELVRSEMQYAADAAARYAVQGISDNTATSKAIAAAAQNSADGTAISISSSDVVVGTYNTTTGLFTAGGASPNAVKVTVARRNGSGMSTTLLRAFGMTNLNVSATGFAMMAASGSGTASAAPTTPGFIGLNWMNINSSTINSWDSATNTTKGGVIGGTNASVNINSSTYSGQLYAGFGPSVTNNGSTITTVSKLTSGYSFAMPTTPGSGVTNLGNYNGPSGASQTFAAGKYYFDSFSVPAGKTVVFSGPVELYINGSCNIGGNITTYQNTPSNTKIRMVCGAGVDIGGGSTPLYLDVYAPQSPLNISARTDVYGSFIMGGVSLSGTHIGVDRNIGSTTAGTWTFTAASSGTVSTILPR
ncbi:MAG: pilus assembly protein TadG-related protein [Tepidisphaeraceae bacterium]